MDKQKFKTNIGHTFQFLPHPRRDTANGSYESDTNLWILTGETVDKKGWEFLNAVANYDRLIIEPVQIRNYDAPDKLILRGQVIIRGASVLFESFHPIPASAVNPTASLRISLGDTSDSGPMELLGPTVNSFRFWASNDGNQTVPDYRVSILFPHEFTSPPYGSYHGNLMEHHETTIENRRYAVYEKAILEPIYKNGGSVKLGEVILSTTVGNHIILWQIRCDEGVFPAEGKYGEIQVIIKPSR